MQPRLTQAAVDLLQRAAALAVELGDHYLGVEHVALAALTHDETASAAALQAIGVPPEPFIQRLRGEIVGYPQLRLRETTNRILVTPRLARALDAGADAAPLDPAALFHRLIDSPHSLLARLVGEFLTEATEEIEETGEASGGARLADALAGLGEAPLPAGQDVKRASSIMDSMAIATHSRRMLDELAAELAREGYELQLDPSVTGWLLLRELENEGETSALDTIFADDICPRLDAATREHPPGSVFCLTLGADKIDLLVVKGKAEA